MFQTPVLAGRGFAPHDTGVGANTVVVNHLFVDRILSGRNAVGRRILYRVEERKAVREPGPWFEIIGVVRDLVPDPEAPMNLDNPAKPLVDHTLGSNRTESYPLYLATHVRSGDPTSMLPTLRRIAAEISPELRLSDIQRLDQGTSSDAHAWNGIANLILLVSAIALVLSLAAFTPSRPSRYRAARARSPFEWRWGLRSQRRRDRLPPALLSGRGGRRRGLRDDGVPRRDGHGDSDGEPAP